MTEQTQPTDAEILDAADDFRSQYKHGGTTFDEFNALGFARAVLAKWGTPAGAGGDHPYAIQWDAELGRTAMRFVDRAGDVHPGIDDAETICADFHAAMSAVIERMPHVQRMSPTPQPTQAQAGAVPLATYRAYALIDSMGWALDDQEKDDMLRLLRATEAAHGITAHGVADMKGGQDG